MICYNCGRDMPDDGLFCTFCGAFQPEGQKNGRGTKHESVIDVHSEYEKSEQRIDSNNLDNNGHKNDNENDISVLGSSNAILAKCEEAKENSIADAFTMKWHKFICYFALWVLAIAKFAHGSKLLSEGGDSDLYGKYSEIVDNIYSIDRTYGAMLIICSILSIIAAVNLLLMKKSGPIFLYSLYASLIAANFIFWCRSRELLEVYNLGDYVSSSSGYNIVINTVTEIIMLAINYVYYTKRKEMFN